METVNAPAAGWYPDPGGSTSRRWWDGAAWTTHLQAPVPPPVPTPVVASMPVAVAAPVAAPVAEPAPYVGDPRFGGPSAAAVPAPPGGPGYVSPATPAAPAYGAVASGRPTSHYVIAGAAALVLLVAAVFIGKSVLGGSDSSDTGDPSGVTGLLAPGNPQVAAMKADVLNIATVEETYFTDKQVYAAGTGAKGALAIGAHRLRLSAAGETVSVALSPSGVGYCIRASRTPAGGGAPQVIVYVSTQGGLQPPQVTTCPAAF